MRFYEWNYDTDTLIEYERDGECNGCGACCMGVITFQVTGGEAFKAIHNPHNGGPTTDEKGVWLSISVGDKRRFFKMVSIEKTDHRCPMLTDDNHCRIHAGKYLFSRAWPMNPSQVRAFEKCSYTFREIGRWKISELEAERA